MITFSQLLNIIMKKIPDMQQPISFVNSKRTVFISFLTIGLAAWLPVSSGETKFSDKSCDFNKVPVNTAYKNDCSPVVYEDNFFGIKIKAPKEVKISQSGKHLTEKYANIPILGYFNISLADLIKDSNIKLIAENSTSGKQFTGNITDQHNMQAMAERAKAFSKKKLDEQSFGSFINPNLAKYVELPNETATYRVSVVLGKYESNPVDLKINTDNSTFTDW